MKMKHIQKPKNETIQTYILESRTLEKIANDQTEFVMMPLYNKNEIN